MVGPESERLAVLETRHDETIRRIEAVEGAVRDLARNVRDFVSAASSDRIKHETLLHADRRLMKWALTILGVIVSASSIYQAMR